MDIFEKYKGATLSGDRYPYLDNREHVGEYVLEAETLKLVVGKVDQQEKYIAEFKVLESSNDLLKPGARVQLIKNPAKAKFPQTVVAEITQLVDTLAGGGPCKPEDYRRAFENPENLFRGQQVRAVVSQKPNGFTIARFKSL